MDYSTFDRQENMTDATRFEIISIIKEISYSDEIEDSISFNLQNSLYGLFDGYLYEDMQIECLSLPAELSTRILTLYHTCNLYNKLETIL